MEVNCHLQAPAALTLYILDMNLCGSHTRAGQCGGQKYRLSVPGTELLSLSIVTILTELPRLQLKLREEGNTTEGKPEKAIKKRNSRR